MRRTVRRRTLPMRRERSPHIVGRHHSEASFKWSGLMVHHLRVRASSNHLWEHGWHVGVRGSRPEGWRETLHVWWRGNRRTLEWHHTGPRAKQTTRRGLEVSGRSTREGTWGSYELVTWWGNEYNVNPTSMITIVPFNKCLVMYIHTLYNYLFIIHMFVNQPMEGLKTTLHHIQTDPWVPSVCWRCWDRPGRRHSASLPRHLWKEVVVQEAWHLGEGNLGRREGGRESGFRLWTISPEKLVRWSLLWCNSKAPRAKDMMITLLKS